MDDPDLTSQRLDRWLWAARFFKSRSLAADAVTGGKVHVDQDRVKPARAIRRGNLLRIRHGTTEWSIVVKGLCLARRPAPEAQALYEETPASAEARAAEENRRREIARERPRGLGRPTKRDRRELDRSRSSDPFD